MAQSGIKINDRQFKETLKKYLQVTKRTIPDIVNTKSFYIIRQAIHQTPKADKLAIGKELSQLIYEFKSTKGGAKRILKTATRFGSRGQANEVPVVALMVNAQRAARGKIGLYGDKMRTAIKNFISSRQRSAAYIKSGWLPALRILAPHAKDKSKAQPLDNSAKQYGKPKGSATPAVQGFRVAAKIENKVATEGKQAGHHSIAVEKFGVPALQKAFDLEEANTKLYIEDKLREAARQSGIKTN